ncbi:MAG: TatD family hydrolase [Alphaproteobacteria bacterium]|nr:MAG: TatD family hydrolase [Alphaproteobacteria bacterium]
MEAMKWIDTHCHLDYSPMFENIENVKKNMEQHNVVGAMSISTTTCTLDKVYPLLVENNMWCAVGVHPLDEKIVCLDEIEEYFSKWIDKEKVVAIGEAGLDGYKGNVLDQVPGFELQLQYAEKYKLPFVLHTRDAEKLTLEILDKYDVMGIAHCYTGSIELAKKLLEKGWFISISGIVTFKNASIVREVAKMIPIKQILVETDSPYLAPVPFRGKTNEPAFVSYVGEFVANLRNMDKEEFANHTTNNFLNLINV